MSVEKHNYRKKIIGVVVSDKADKTVVVKVARRFMHSRYNKFISTSKKYHAHDENEVAKIGDKVLIIESKPISKLKKWSLVKVL